ncbi:thiamine pyrophosphate-dependent enzyme [Streptosporangium sp. NPDC001681]|uniref:thiamine pyrophosphate-binding protein n=1 Tax=Streptosporangium sp. NPDC001681 TaxID=3154395 RepID=UPI00332452CB
MRVHEALAAAVAANEVDTLFGLLGDSNLFMVNAFVEQQHGRYVSAVHEAGAVMMAHGYACRSGRLGVATVTQGPGLTNTVTALVEAVRSATPLVLICGDTNPGNTANVQSLAQAPLVAATGADYMLVERPEDAAAAFHRAARRARDGRRPVVLNCPTSFQWHEVGEPLIADAGLVLGAVQEPEESALDAAVGVLAASRRPLVLAGRGVLDKPARDAVLDLAERLGAPIATTLKARGLYTAEEGSVGVFGTLSTAIGVETINDADCVVAFGAGLNTWTTAGTELLEGKSVVHVDDDPSAIGRHAPVTAGVPGDAAVTARTIVDWLDTAEIPTSSYRELVRRRLTPEALRWTETSTDSFSLAAVLSAIDAALPAVRTIVQDGGRFLGESFRYLGTHEPAAHVLSTSFGAVGLGMGAAIGAACAAPDEPTVLITGDGGFMMSGLAELQSAVRHGIPLTVVVCNDGSYGAEYDQFINRGIDPGLSLFEWPQFADLAGPLGCKGLTVSTMADLAPALAAMRDSDRPVVIDVKIAPDAIPEVPH